MILSELVLYQFINYFHLQSLMIPLRNPSKRNKLTNLMITEQVKSPKVTSQLRKGKEISLRRLIRNKLA